MAANKNIFPEDDHFFPAIGESSRLLVGCRREDYSASRIAHAIEDCNAHLLNLNITSLSNFNDNDECNDFTDECDCKFPVVVDLRVSHRHALSISRSLERYGYTVLASRGADETDDETFRSRIDGLFRYLEI